MQIFEVHISRSAGVVEEGAHRVVDLDPGSAALVTVPWSLFLRTGDRALAERAVSTWERTARRADDRHAWIRVVA